MSSPVGEVLKVYGSYILYVIRIILIKGIKSSPFS